MTFLLDTPIGPLTVGISTLGVQTIDFGRKKKSTVNEDQLSAAELRSVQKIFGAMQKEFAQYFAGKRKEFSFPLDRSTRRGFRGDVLQCLESVRYGQTLSYSDLAKKAGSPRAYRAVGSAMATNPLPIVVPCHRVLPADGTLGNYGGGAKIKAFLLQLEGVDFDARKA